MVLCVFEGIGLQHQLLETFGVAEALGHLAAGVVARLAAQLVGCLKNALPVCQSFRLA